MDLEAPPPSPDAYVDMGPVDTSHYQGLWELRRGLQQDQQQQDDEEEELQPFLMELVSALITYTILSCSHAVVRLCSLLSEVKAFLEERARKRERERERDSCFNLLPILKFIYSIGE